MVRFKSRLWRVSKDKRTSQEWTYFPITAVRMWQLRFNTTDVPDTCVEIPVIQGAEW